MRRCEARRCRVGPGWWMEQATSAGESGRRRPASGPPGGAAALPAGAASFDGDSWPHEGGLVAQGGSSPETVAAERRIVWRQAERE
jgi:hypothetical protein